MSYKSFVFDVAQKSLQEVNAIGGIKGFVAKNLANADDIARSVPIARQMKEDMFKAKAISVFGDDTRYKEFDKRSRDIAKTLMIPQDQIDSVGPLELNHIINIDGRVMTGIYGDNIIKNPDGSIPDLVTEWENIEDLMLRDDGVSPLDPFRLANLPANVTADVAATVQSFWSPDSGAFGVRLGTSTGAYAVGALGTRFLSGGTITRNDKGERDIAGIPFI